MPCTVRCKCGKSTQQFKKLNPEDIETFECSKCPKSSKEKIDKSEPVAPPAPPVKPESRAERKAREKAGRDISPMADDEEDNEID